MTDFKATYYYTYQVPGGEEVRPRKCEGRLPNLSRQLRACQNQARGFTKHWGGGKATLRIYRNEKVVETRALN